jgi:hypothetical protein
MSSTQTSLDVLKQELSRLSTYTTEIGKAQEVATHAQAAAVAVIEAAEAVDLKNRQLLDALKTEHLRGINEQTSILRKAAQQQASEAQALIKQEVGDLRLGAETAAKALQQVLNEQPRILSAITAQHQAAGSSQTDLLRQVIGESVSSFDKQFTAHIQELDQARKDFDSSVSKQLDVLTTITDRLQVISGSLTAFRDAMNAAQFTDRLESLAAQQLKQIAVSETSHAALMERLAKLDGLKEFNEEINAKLISLKNQNLVLQAALLVGVIVLIALHFVK